MINLVFPSNFPQEAITRISNSRVKSTLSFYMHDFVTKGPNHRTVGGVVHVNHSELNYSRRELDYFTYLAIRLIKSTLWIDLFFLS